MSAPAWHKYREPVLAFLPTAQGEGLRLRSGIALLRDQATQSLKTAELEARPILHEIERMGVIWWISQADEQRLQCIMEAMAGMYAIARNINTEFRGASPG